MASSVILAPSFSSAWEVFLLFAIPIGGGIPAGVMLAKSHGIQWPTMLILYFISDVLLACVFEPFVMLMVLAGKKHPYIAKFNEFMKKSTEKTISRYGIKLGPFSLIMVSFGVDPMTGRTAALAAGHGFIPGWALAIIGDMIFFTVLMASSLWLDGILGDGTWTAIIIMVAMTVVPILYRRVRIWW